MKNLQPDEIRKLVQQAYGQIAMAGRPVRRVAAAAVEGRTRMIMPDHWDTPTKSLRRFPPAPTWR